jgi:hypothetical protein
MVAYWAVNSGGNWSVGSTWSTISAKDASRVGGSVVPSSTSDCVIDDYSGNVNIIAASSCKSADFTSGGNYTGTLTNSSTLSCYNELTLSPNMNLVHNNGYITFRGTNISLNCNGKGIPFDVNIGLLPAYIYLKGNAYFNNCLNFSPSATTTSGFSGSYDLYVNNLVICPKNSESNILKLPDCRTLYVSGAFLCAKGSDSDNYSPGRVTIVSNTATSGSYITHTGGIENQFITDTYFTDIISSGSNLYVYQGSGANIIRCSNIYTFNPPPTTTGSSGFIIL